MYACMHVCMYVCMNEWMNIHSHIHIYIYTSMHAKMEVTYPTSRRVCPPLKTRMEFLASDLARLIPALIWAQMIAGNPILRWYGRRYQPSSDLAAIFILLSRITAWPATTIRWVGGATWNSSSPFNFSGLKDATLFLSDCKIKTNYKGRIRKS